jgi:SAM-dependent methyltransferase
MTQMFDLSVNRSLRLVLPLIAIEPIRTSVAQRTILTIGPRTEGEIFNLISYGFRKRNITAVDLISYSPLIRLADMHALPFADRSFDIVMAGWVIAYSDQKAKAASEMLRVVKPGGIVALGVEWSRFTPEQYAQGFAAGSRERLMNIESILKLYEGHVAHVYFAHDEQARSPQGSGDMLVIFRTPA